MSMIYEYCYPGEDGVTPVYERLDEEDILDRFWYHWYDRMVSKYGEFFHVKNKWSNMELREMCIQDWVTVHWAYPIWNWDVE